MPNIDEIDALVEEFELLYVKGMMLSERDRQKLRDELIEQKALELLRKIEEKRIEQWKNNGSL